MLETGAWNQIWHSDDSPNPKAEDGIWKQECYGAALELCSRQTLLSFDMGAWRDQEWTVRVILTISEKKRVLAKVPLTESPRGHGWIVDRHMEVKTLLLVSLMVTRTEFLELRWSLLHGVKNWVSCAHVQCFCGRQNVQTTKFSPGYF